MLGRGYIWGYVVSEEGVLSEVLSRDMPLTDTQIKRTKPQEKPYRMSDSEGMYLWVTPSGGKLWRWAYVHEGKEKLMALGKYPGCVSCHCARATCCFAQATSNWCGSDGSAQSW